MNIGPRPPRLQNLQTGTTKPVAPAREQRPDSNTANKLINQFVAAQAARTETLSCQQSNAKARLASRLKQRSEDRPPISDASPSQLTVFKMPEKLSGPQVVESLKSQFSRYLVDSAETDRGVCEFAISEMVDDDKAYCLLIHKDLAIICPAVESQSEKSAAQILSDSSLNDVRVYDFSEPLGGYPRLYSDTFLNASCDLYTSGELPDVILHKIEGLQFSPEKFVNKDIVQFVTETLLTPFVAQNPELGAKMQRIVQTSILNAGAEVRISKRVDDDIDIKNRINMVLINDDSENPVSSAQLFL